MKMKRFFTVILALCMLCSLMATPISAEETDVVETVVQEEIIVDNSNEDEETYVVVDADDEVNVELSVGSQISFQDISGSYSESEENPGGIVNVSLQNASFFANESAGDVLIPGIGYYIQNSRAANLPLLTSTVIYTDELALSGNLNNPPENAIWYVEKIGDSFALRQGDGYLDMPYEAGACTIETPVELNLVFQSNNRYWQINKGTAYGLNDYGGDGDNAAAYWNYSDAGNAWKFYYAQDTVYTEITFTGLTVGETEVRVGNTVYHITVVPRGGEKNLTLSYGEEVTIEAGLLDGESVTWTTTSTDVAYLHDASGKFVKIVGRSAGQATVTGTVKDAGGSVVATYLWHITVNEKQDSGTNKVTAVVSGLNTIFAKAYYSVNGGPLQEMPELEDGETLTVEYTGSAFGIYFFGIPNEGYALTHIGATLGSTFDSLMDGEDGVQSSTFGQKLLTHTHIMTSAQATTLLEEAKALGVAGGCFYTRTFSDTINIGTLSFVAQPLPTISKKITGIIRDDEFISYVPGMKVILGDEIHYGITITNTATDANYGHITFSELTLTDNLVEITEQPGWTTSETDQVFMTEVAIKLGLNNYADCVVNGVITNTATLDCVFSSTYSRGSAKSHSTAVAEIKVKSPYYVIDFGLPLDISLDQNVVGNMEISDASAKFGTVTYDGIKLTYTPDTVLTDEDFITLTLQDAQGNSYGYGVWIYPASSVYYEEGFISGWSGGSKGTQQQTALHEDQNEQYGFDTAYQNVLTGGSQMSSNAPGVQTASFAFTGTGMDLYANCSGSTGSLLVMLKNADTGYVEGLFQVDTAFKPGQSVLTDFQQGNAYGLPIVSLSGLSHGNYAVTVYHVANPDGSSGAVNLDGFRVYGTLPDQSVYVEDGEAYPNFIQLRDALLNAVNVTQVQAESQYAEDIASGIMQQVLNTGVSLNGALLLANDANVTFDEDTSLDLLDNGPKNEIYLRPGYSLVFNLPAGIEAQVGLKAVKGEAATCTLNGATVNVNSSVDMFYPISLGSNGSVTITNTTGGIVAVTELKLLGGAQPALTAFTADSFVPMLLSAGYESAGDRSCADGHAWGEWAVIREATLDEQGCREHTCTVCGAVEEETFYLGDLNGDDTVDGADAMLLRQFVARWKLDDVNLAAADIDGNGTVDGADAMALRQMIAG